MDGRLQVGDEISHINGLSVVDAPHQNVITAMGEAAAQGEVVIKISRKMPIPGLPSPSATLHDLCHASTAQLLFYSALYSASH